LELCHEGAGILSRLREDTVPFAPSISPGYGERLIFALGPNDGMEEGRINLQFLSVTGDTPIPMIGGGRESGGRDLWKDPGEETSEEDGCQEAWSV
jgi:hypothetical protein